MRQVGHRLRAADVRRIYLVHGTFVGADAAGVFTALARVYPPLRELVRPLSKLLVDGLAGERGNYTQGFAQLLEDVLNQDDALRIEVRRFIWSSENHHLGRADGAVRLLGELAETAGPAGRVLLWGHSHAGNVFALASNLLAGDGETCEQFFTAARTYYRRPLRGQVDLPVWDSLGTKLARGERPIDPARLDLVTFGTPLRYGWDSDGYGRLLHFVNHRPLDEERPCRAVFPPTLDQLLHAAGGDYVQQFGIAGTNLMPALFTWRSYLADRRLHALLQADIEPADLLSRLRAGCRVPHEGTTLLVDYGPEDSNLARHLAGHAVYTRSEWLLFHAEQVADEFYGSA